jgi:hypothetical protein
MYIRLGPLPLHSRKNGHEITNEVFSFQHIFLTPADAALPDGEDDWSNVLVIAKHKQNPDEDRSTKTLLQPAGYAREVLEVDRSGDSCLALRSAEA